MYGGGAGWRSPLPKYARFVALLPPNLFGKK
jgi:hypothetical protein